MDAVIEEIGRIGSPTDMQAHSLRRYQAYLRDVIQPKLDRLAAFEAAEQATLFGGSPKRKGGA